MKLCTFNMGKTFLKCMACCMLMAAVVFAPWPASAQLEVTHSPPAVSGNKAVVKLAMKNQFAERIESARAVVFLSDEQGKMVANATKWVIGGTKGSTALARGTETTYEFVLPLGKSVTTTNLTANVSFIRLILNGGRVADPSTGVSVSSSNTSKSPKKGH